MCTSTRSRCLAARPSSFRIARTPLPHSCYYETDVRSELTPGCADAPKALYRRFCWRNIHLRAFHEVARPPECLSFSSYTIHKSMKGPLERPLATIIDRLCSIPRCAFSQSLPVFSPPPPLRLSCREGKSNAIPLDLEVHASWLSEAVPRMRH